MMLLPWVSGTLGKPPEKKPLNRGLGEGSRVQTPAGPPYQHMRVRSGVSPVPTAQQVLWKTMQNSLPSNSWLGLQQIYDAVRTHVALKPEDYQPASKKGGVAWERNVRNVLQYRRTTREVVWSGELPEYMLISNAQATAILAELRLRMALWSELKKLEQRNKTSAETIRRLELHKGEQGIFFDKRRTTGLAPGGGGVAVSVLPTGTYPDELGEDGILYHFPRTGRSGRRDQNEIDAVKAAKNLELPIFVIIPAAHDPSGRDVRLGWVMSWNDVNRTFYIHYGNEPPTTPLSTTDEEPFKAIEERETPKRLVAGRQGQVRFKFDVIARYGDSCAVCEMKLAPLLQAAHLVPVEERGSDDPRNGLVLCANHHRAFDSHLFGINPDTLNILIREDGPTIVDLGLTKENLSGLAKKPHIEALRWRWHRFQSEKSSRHN